MLWGGLIGGRVGQGPLLPHPVVIVGLELVVDYAGDGAVLSVGHPGCSSAGGEATGPRRRRFSASVRYAIHSIRRPRLLRARSRPAIQRSCWTRSRPLNGPWERVCDAQQPTLLPDSTFSDR